MHHDNQHRPVRRLGPALAFVAGLAAAAATGIVLTSHHAGAAVVQATPAVPATPVAANAEFVAITPCRLMDTRPGGDNVGPRATPLGAGETHVLQVTGGVNGNCALPAAAAVALNATAVGGTETSFLTFFPDDASLPLSSNLNFGPGQAPTPNKVDVRLSETGSLGIFNAFGQVNVVVDVMGYYVAASPTPFATTAHSDGQSLGDEAESIVSVSVTAPAAGAIVVSSFAQLNSAGGGRADCSINDELAVDADHLQIYNRATAGPASVAGSRTFALSAGEQTTIRLMCRRVSGLVGVNEADLSAIFVPSFLPQQGPQQLMASSD